MPTLLINMGVRWGSIFLRDLCVLRAFVVKKRGDNHEDAKEQRTTKGYNSFENI